jgi:hypothetical protein
MFVRERVEHGRRLDTAQVTTAAAPAAELKLAAEIA